MTLRPDIPNGPCFGMIEIYIYIYMYLFIYTHIYECMYIYTFLHLGLKGVLLLWGYVPGS